MSFARSLTNTYAEYLAIEQHSNVRHEFIGGEIYAMAGGTPAHGALAARISRILDGLLSGCTALSSDVRVHIAAAEMTTYPDVSFVCGSVKTSPDDEQAIINPSLIVEVTSPSTRSTTEPRSSRRISGWIRFAQLSSSRTESRASLSSSARRHGWHKTSCTLRAFQFPQLVQCLPSTMSIPCSNSSSDFNS